MIDNNQDSMVRKIAHQLWIEAGKPEGEADKHWYDAIRRAAKHPPVVVKEVISPPPPEPFEADSNN